MDRTVTLLAGVGLGAGLMYILDPKMGRRRRDFAYNQATNLAQEVRHTAEVVAEDATNKARGLASGDLSVLVGGKEGLRHPFQGRWSPTARSLMGLAGGGLLLYGLTQEAPEACILGTVGLVMLAEGVTGAGVDDIARVPQQVANLASNAASSAAESLGFGGEGRTSQQRGRQPARAGA